MHKHTFGLSHKKARRFTLFLQWFLWLYCIGRWGWCSPAPSPVWAGDTSYVATRQVAAPGLVRSGRKKGEDPGCENELEPWKGMNMLFYPLHSLSCVFFFLLHIFLLPCDQVKGSHLGPVSASHVHSLVSAGFFALIFSSHPFPSLSVVFHCVLMWGTWRKRPPHLFVCLWESYFLSTKGFWAAAFLFSPDERQMFRIPRSISFSRFLEFSKILWRKAAWDPSKNDIKAFYFQVFLYSQGHIKALWYTCTGVCMCSREQCLKRFASAW